MEKNNYLIFAISVFALVFLAGFASALNPIVTIFANPNVTQNVSVITASAIDLSGKGIESTQIYENNILVKSCSSANCVYTIAHTSIGKRSYYAKTKDKAGNSAKSSVILSLIHI